MSTIDTEAASREAARRQLHSDLAAGRARTAALVDLSALSLDAHGPYRDALTTLQRLRAQRGEVEAVHREGVRAAEDADQQAVQAEAAVMIDQGDKKAATAALARFDQAQAKAQELQRQLRTLDEAIRLQEDKCKTLQADAREQVKRTARALHEPLMQRAVVLMRELAEILQQHQQIEYALLRTIDGVRGAIAQPGQLPEVTFDKRSGGALITGSVDNVVRELRQAGYDIP